MWVLLLKFKNDYLSIHTHKKASDNTGFFTVELTFDFFFYIIFGAIHAKFF